MRRGEKLFSVGNELGSPCFWAKEARGGLFHGGAAGRTLAVLSADHLLVNVMDLMEPYYLHVPIAGGYMGSSSSAPSAWRSPWSRHRENVSHSVVSDPLKPMNCSLPGSSVCGVLQARILEWVAISFSKGSSQPRD